MFAKWSHWSRVRGHVYPAGHKLFIQTCLWPFNHTSCRRASLWNSRGSETVKSKSTGSTTHYRKRQKAWHIQSKSLWLPFDLPSLCQEEKQPTWSVVIYLSVWGKWEVDSLNPTLLDALIPFYHLSRWLKFWTDFKKCICKCDSWEAISSTGVTIPCKQ